MYAASCIKPSTSLPLACAAWDVSEGASPHVMSRHTRCLTKPSPKAKSNCKLEPQA